MLRLKNKFLFYIRCFYPIHISLRYNFSLPLAIIIYKTYIEYSISGFRRFQVCISSEENVALAIALIILHFNIPII